MRHKFQYLGKLHSKKLILLDMIHKVLVCRLNALDFG